MLALFAFATCWTLTLLACSSQAAAQVGSGVAPIVEADKALSSRESTASDQVRDKVGIQAPAEAAGSPLVEQRADPLPTIQRSKEPLRVNALKTPDTSISGIGTGSTPEDATEGRLPGVMPLPYGPDRESVPGGDVGWSLKYKYWVAPAYCHQPTYYEDVMLEHHGHERCPPLQPLMSGARFYSGLFFTPYLAYLRPPLVDIPNTGNYRPGSCAPALRQRATYDPGAVKVQAAAAATGVLALQP